MAGPVLSSTGGHDPGTRSPVPPGRTTRAVRSVVAAVLAALAGAVVVVLTQGAQPQQTSSQVPVTSSRQPAPTPFPAPDPTETHTVWHWNVAGSTLHGGAVDDGLVEVLVASVLTRGADLVSLNEVCRQQFDAVVAGLAGAGWAQDPARSAVFHATVEAAPDVCGGQPFGLALLSAAPVGDVRTTVLPDDGTGATRALLCAVVGPRPLRFCTTHVTTSSLPDPATGLPRNVLQLRAVAVELATYAGQGETALLAGDLNAQPHYARLDDWYAPSVATPANGANSGRYRELDDTDRGCPGYGEPTALGPPGEAPPCGGGAKVDHLFVREDRIAGGYRANALEIPHSCPGVPERPGVNAAGACSDHHVLLGTVTVRVRA